MGTMTFNLTAKYPGNNAAIETPEQAMLRHVGNNDIHVNSELRAKLENFMADTSIADKVSAIERSLSSKADAAAVELELAGKANSAHTHTEYALASHAHEQYLTSSAVREIVDGAVAGAFHFRGEVDVLPATAAPGDVYQVGDKEYVWDEGKNDFVELGYPVDLSAYATKSNVADMVSAAVEEESSRVDLALAEKAPVGDLTALGAKVSAIESTLADKAADADLQTLTGIVSSKVNVADLESAVSSIDAAIATVSDGLAGKADAASVEAVSSAVGVVEASVQTINESIASKADAASLENLADAVSSSFDVMAAVVGNKANAAEVASAIQNMENAANVLDAEKATVEAVNGQTRDIPDLAARVQVLEALIASLSKANPELLEVESGMGIATSQPAADVVVTGSADKSGTVTCRSLEMEGVELALPSGESLVNDTNALLIDASKDISLNECQLSMQNAASSNLVKVTGADRLTIRNTEFTGETYNTIMTGQNTTGFLKDVLIDNCLFNETCHHVNIWFAGHQDNAVLTIRGCKFLTCEQFLCISDFANPANRLTVNLIDCEIGSYEGDDGQGAPWRGVDVSGFILIESRNIGDRDAVVAANPYGNGKCVINIQNLTANGIRITADNFEMATNRPGQHLYYYWQTQNRSDLGVFVHTPETHYLFPTVIIDGKPVTI